MAQTYKKAPITEATIEFRLASALSDRDLGRTKARFKRAGWTAEDLAEFALKIGPQPEVKQTPIGGKFTSGDGMYVVQILRKSLVVSRNSPYCGWDAFIAQVRLHYDRWRKIVGNQPLERIGVRYINRIDIPLVGKPIDPTEYFTYGPPVTLALSNPPLGWHVQTLSKDRTGNLSVTLTSATVDSPLIGHLSVLLDTDIYRYQVDVPQADDQIWGLIAAVRESKNEIFEACITDKTRALIS